MKKLNKRTQQIERRNIISSVFIGILIGLAYSEMVPAIRDSFHSRGITFGTSMLCLIFFTTSMRFFIGNQLHLVSSTMTKLPGKIWFYDFCIIVIETTILIFLGGVCSVELSLNARIGFVELLLTLYVIDIVWTGSQWILGKLFLSWRRPFIPWAWAILNTSLVIGIVILGIIGKDFYTFLMLGLLGILNTIAFVVDVMLVDSYDLL